jgi:hypothetical protein
LRCAATIVSGASTMLKIKLLHRYGCHSVAKETDTRPRSAIQNLQRLVHGQASIASDSIWYPCRSF